MFPRKYLQESDFIINFYICGQKLEILDYNGLHICSAALYSKREKLSAESHQMVNLALRQLVTIVKLCLTMDAALSRNNTEWTLQCTQALSFHTTSCPWSFSYCVSKIIMAICLIQNQEMQSFPLILCYCRKPCSSKTDFYILMLILVFFCLKDAFFFQKKPSESQILWVYKVEFLY